MSFSCSPWPASEDPLPANGALPSETHHRAFSSIQALTYIRIAVLVAQGWIHLPLERRHVVLERTSFELLAGLSEAASRAPPFGCGSLYWYTTLEVQGFQLCFQPPLYLRRISLEACSARQAQGAEGGEGRDGQAMLPKSQPLQGQGQGQGQLRGVPWGTTAAFPKQQRRQILQRPLHPRQQPGSSRVLGKRRRSQHPTRRSFKHRHSTVQAADDGVWISVLALGVLLYLHTLASVSGRPARPRDRSLHRFWQEKEHINTSQIHSHSHSHSHRHRHSHSHSQSRSHIHSQSQSHRRLGTLGLGGLVRRFRGRVSQGVPVDGGAEEGEMGAWGEAGDVRALGRAQPVAAPRGLLEVVYRKRKELQGLEGFHVSGDGYSDSGGHSDSDGHSGSSTSDSSTSGSRARRVRVCYPHYPPGFQSNNERWGSRVRRRGKPCQGLA